MKLSKVKTSALEMKQLTKLRDSLSLFKERKTFVDVYPILNKDLKKEYIKTSDPVDKLVN